MIKQDKQLVLKKFYLQSLDSNGNKNEVWDLSGNLIEFVDWTLGGVYDAGPSNCPNNGWVEIMNYSCANLLEVYYRPLNPANINNYSSTNQKLGEIFYSTTTNTGFAIRGGNFTSSNGQSGVYSINFYPDVINDISERRGFRCVYRF